MWKHRDELIGELVVHGISEPVDTQQESYEALLKESRPWWELARAFKSRRLPYGFRLFIAPDFGADVAIPDSGMEGTEVS